MKKLITILIFAASILISGCDTTDTTTITINLGGTRAAPAGVSLVYIGVFPVEGVADPQLGNCRVAAVFGSTNTISLVVPNKMDLYILVMATNNNDPDLFYAGEGYYNGASGQSGNTVSVAMSELNISTAVYASEGTSVFASGSFNLNLGSGVIQDIDVFEKMELHLEKKSDGGSYSIIAKVPFDQAYDNYSFTDHTAVVSFWYRARVYVPNFNLYLYTWGEVQSTGP